MFTWHILFLNFWSSLVWVCFSPHQRNICEYKLHGKPIMKLLLLLMLNKPGLFNVKSKLIFFSFFSIWFFFLSRTFTIHRTAGEEGRYLFNSSLPLPTASQTLRHYRTVTAETSPLHIASSWTRTWNLRFSSASR